jgi:hypothetical protein
LGAGQIRRRESDGRYRGLLFPLAAIGDHSKCAARYSSASQPYAVASISREVQLTVGRVSLGYRLRRWPLAISIL